MKKLRKKVYMTAGYNTVSMGTGRKEFHPKKVRPGLEEYITEAGKATIDMLGGSDKVDECVMGNFMAARFNKQANLPAFFPMIDKGLKGKPATSVEGACCSGGLALISGIKSVLAETADVVLTLGFEVQNTVKAVYGADILAGAGWFRKRADGHAYFFPGVFSNRAGAYFEKYGKEKTKKALAIWYKNAIENARLCPTAQEFHNNDRYLLKTGLKEPDPEKFVDFLNFADCSKVSDGASSIAILSEDGLNAVDIKDVIEVVGVGHSTTDITKAPDDLCELSTIKDAVQKALNMAGITINQLGTVETHDCFTIAGILGVEAIGFAEKGYGPEFVISGNTARDGSVPFNTTGGLIGWGHPTGATGIHQAVTIWEQLTGRAGAAQIKISGKRPYGMTVNMGGDDKTVVVIIFKKA